MRARLILASTLALALAGPTIAQEHDHGAHGAQHQHQHGAQAGHHGHEHAAFQSDRLHVRIDGPAGAPDLILIPGLGSSPEVWQGTVDHLGDRYRVHRVHVHGFAGAAAGGNAEGPVSAPVAEEIARYIREAGLEKPAVVGHSMGGTMGMMLAARHPDLVGRLMVVDMIPFMGSAFGGATATSASVTPIADQVYAAQANAPRDQYVAQATASINGMINTADRREEALQHMRDSDQKVSAAAFRELIVTDLRPELAKITAPTQVLYVPFNAPGMTPETTDAIYTASFQSLPRAELKRIDDSAHFIMWDQADRFHAELDRFLSE